MTELKCPFCDEKLVRYWGMEKPALYCCDNPKCSKGGIGTKQSWQALADTKKKLDMLQEFITKLYLNDNITDEQLHWLKQIKNEKRRTK